MKAKIDAGLCTGCEACVQVAPEVFEMGGDSIAVVKADPVPAAEVANVREAVSSCPASCIEIVE